MNLKSLKRGMLHVLVPAFALAAVLAVPGVPASTAETTDAEREALSASVSKWIKEQSRHLQAFAWQNGYGAFSVSPSHLRGLRKYIVGQEEHHRRESFQDELRRLLRKYGVEYDERYVWD